MSPSANILEAPLVLIVDDDVSVRRSTARLLRSSGLRAESFASAQQLLESENTIRADCLIVDVRMPGIDGLQLMRCLRANNQRIPVIFFTGEAAQEDEDWALRVGALAFLRKPVGKGALRRLIQMALESAKHATQLAKANEVLRGCLDRLASLMTESDQFVAKTTRLFKTRSRMLRLFPRAVNGEPRLGWTRNSLYQETVELRCPTVLGRCRPLKTNNTKRGTKIWT